MTCREIMDALEKRWNPSYAMAWDNVGLLVGREEKEISKIFVAPTEGRVPDDPMARSNCLSFRLHHQMAF